MGRQAAQKISAEMAPRKVTPVASGAEMAQAFPEDQEVKPAAEAKMATLVVPDAPWPVCLQVYHRRGSPVHHRKSEFRNLYKNPL